MDSKLREARVAGKPADNTMLSAGRFSKKGASHDVHLASDVVSSELDLKFKSLGFVRDAFIGGTTGVVHPCHYSAHPDSRSQMCQLWERSVALLETSGPAEFQGYAEAEVTPPQFRAYFSQKPFDQTVPLPFTRLSYSTCSPGEWKDLDIHVTVDLESLDPRLKSVMEVDLNFLYVDIRRPSGSVVRVYTCQPLGLKKFPQLFWSLKTYLEKAGGFEGKMKLEATWAFARFPEQAPVPPVVVEMPTISW